MKTTNECRVELVDYMGSDRAVAEAAWVSTARADDRSDEDVARLIRYLARHGHWTPFGQTAVKLRIHAPVFVLRQLMRSNVGVVWNEESRRYVDSEPVVFVPDVWRRRAKNVKQGSSEQSVTQGSPHMVAGHALRTALQAYDELLEIGVAPEQARMVLPQAMMSTVVGTGSVAFWARVCRLRLDRHAQKEIRDLAQKISDIIAPLFPVSWEALVGVKK